jgi:hypothetical protein
LTSAHIPNSALTRPPLTPGDKFVKVNNGGPVLRAMLLCLRNASSARVTASTDYPAQWDFVFNNRDRFLISDSQLVSDIAEVYGYQQGTGANGFGTAPSYDVANGLDNGVRTFPYFFDFGGIRPTDPRTQYQVTGDATLLQIRGTSFGANVATIEVLTNLIRPKSAGGLYPPSRIS